MSLDRVSFAREPTVKQHFAYFLCRHDCLYTKMIQKFNNFECFLHDWIYIVVIRIVGKR